MTVMMHASATPSLSQRIDRATTLAATRGINTQMIHTAVEELTRQNVQVEQIADLVTQAPAGDPRTITRLGIIAAWNGQDQVQPDTIGRLEQLATSDRRLQAAVGVALAKHAPDRAHQHLLLGEISMHAPESAEDGCVRGIAGYLADSSAMAAKPDTQLALAMIAGGSRVRQDGSWEAQRVRAAADRVAAQPGTPELPWVGQDQIQRVLSAASPQAAAAVVSDRTLASRIPTDAPMDGAHAWQHWAGQELGRRHRIAWQDRTQDTTLDSLAEPAGFYRKLAQRSEPVRTALAESTVRSFAATGYRDARTARALVGLAEAGSPPTA